MKTLAALVFFLTAYSASAAPITALSCIHPESGVFATIAISTNLFAPSAQRILAYAVHTGKNPQGGERIENEKRYESESNAKIFDTDAAAYDYVKTNAVVIPLTQGRETEGVLVVEAGKKSATLVDPVYETVVRLECLVN